MISEGGDQIFVGFVRVTPVKDDNDVPSQSAGLPRQRDGMRDDDD